MNRKFINSKKKLNKQFPGDRDRWCRREIINEIVRTFQDVESFINTYNNVNIIMLFFFNARFCKNSKAGLIDEIM